MGVAISLARAIHGMNCSFERLELHAADLTAKQKQELIEKWKEILSGLKSGNDLAASIGDPKRGRAAIRIGDTHDPKVHGMTDPFTNAITISEKALSEYHRELVIGGISSDAALERLSVGFAPIVAHELKHFQNGVGLAKVLGSKLTTLCAEDEALARNAEMQVFREIVITRGADKVKVDESFDSNRVRLLLEFRNDGILGLLAFVKKMQPELDSILDADPEKLGAKNLNEHREAFKLAKTTLELIALRDKALNDAKTAEDKATVSRIFGTLAVREDAELLRDRSRISIKVCEDKVAFAAYMKFYKDQIAEARKK